MGGHDCAGGVHAGGSTLLRLVGRGWRFHTPLAEAADAATMEHDYDTSHDPYQTPPRRVIIDDDSSSDDSSVDDSFSDDEEHLDGAIRPPHGAETVLFEG